MRIENHPLIKKSIFSCLLVLCIAAGSISCYGQVYFLTRDVINNTKYLRKKQEVHEIKSFYKENDRIIINFTATLSRKSKRQPYHIVLQADSVLSYYRNRSSFHHTFDSAATEKYHVRSISTRYSNISGRMRSRGVNVMCLKEMIDTGFYRPPSPSNTKDSAGIVADQNSELFEFDYPQRIYLKGMHIVLIYYFGEPKVIDGEAIDYIVINIENSPKVNKWNYFKLPYTIIADTIMFPFALMMQHHR